MDEGSSGGGGRRRGGGGGDGKKDLGTISLHKNVNTAKGPPSIVHPS